MLVKDGKEYRNLEEQVEKNQSDIKMLRSGIKIDYWLQDITDLSDFMVQDNVGKYFYIGEIDKLYTITYRKNGGLVAINLGDYPAKGPQGDTGLQGPKGDTGERGERGPRGYTGNDGPQGLNGAGWDSLSDLDSSIYTPTISGPTDSFFTMETSANLIINKGTADEETKVIELKMDIPVPNADQIDDTNTTKKFVTATEKSTWNAKQDALTFDSTPTAGSNNPVYSKGIKSFVENKLAQLPVQTKWTTDYGNDFNNLMTEGEYLAYFIPATTAHKPPIDSTGLVSMMVWLEVEKQWISNDEEYYHQYVSLGTEIYFRTAYVDKINATTTWSDWETYTAVSNNYLITTAEGLQVTFTTTSNNTTVTVVNTNTEDAVKWNNLDLIDWGDGKTSKPVAAGTDYTHTYTTAGTYTASFVNLNGDGLTIGASAFQSNNYITKVHVGKKVVEFGGAAFDACPNLTYVYMTEGNRTFGNFIFRSCTSITQASIPEGTTALGRGIFQNCTGLIQLTLPSTLTSFGNNLCNGCSNIKNFIINNPVSVVTIGTTPVSTNANLYIIVPRNLLADYKADSSWSAYSNYLHSISYD